LGQGQGLVLTCTKAQAKSLRGDMTCFAHCGDGV
jgi:hypothetical protein